MKSLNKEELTSPIYGKQEGESKKYHDAFKVFLNSDTRSFKDFYDNYEIYLEKYNKEFTKGSHISITLPKSYDVFRKWTSCLLWTSRFEQYDQEVSEDAMKTIKKKSSDNLVKLWSKWNNIEHKALEAAEELFDSERNSKNAYGAKENVSSAKTAQEAKRLYEEESTENISTINEHNLKEEHNSFKGLKDYQLRKWLENDS